jgi:sulfate adenylyltransferase subunit 1 (EFTu-like GTPase family)
LVLVDTPGHLEFLRNAVTGATHADAAVLVVAADEGVRDQTRRHAFVLAFLGLRHVVVACTKMDQVGYSRDRFEEVVGQSRGMLAAVGLEARAAVPVSAPEGVNLRELSPATPWYTDPPLVSCLEELPPPALASCPARFAVQDVYRFGPGPAVAGKLLSGSVGEGDCLRCLPSGGQVQVRRILRFPDGRGPVAAGECVALEVDGECPRRGDVLAALPGPTVSPVVGGRLLWWSETPLRTGDRLTLRCATQEVRGQVADLTERTETAHLEPLTPADGPVRAGEAAVITFAADRPLVVEPFDRLPALGRFVLETAAGPAGAGVCLDGFGGLQLR